MHLRYLCRYLPMGLKYWASHGFTAKNLSMEWCKYYNGRSGKLIGKKARQYQTWTIAVLLVSKALLENSNHLALISFYEDPDINACLI
jgi:hypothetical protein